MRSETPTVRPGGAGFHYGNPQCLGPGGRWDIGGHSPSGLNGTLGPTVYAGPMTASMFGRAEELATAIAMLEDVRQGPAGLLIEGDVGSGKTTLRRVVVAEARARGYRVLETHPVESEQSLPYAALGDLLGGMAGHPDLDLPGPQERALRVAVLLEEPEDGPPDPRAVALATLNALRSMAQRSPLVVAVDDLHWMDGPSARVLEFVVRRLQEERIGVVAASRETPRALLSGLFDRSFSGREAHRLSMTPLGVEALDEVLRSRLAAALPRQVLAQVHRASGGNPLFALEIARGMQRGEIRPTTTEPLVVPATLQQYARERLSQLPREVRDLLFSVASTADPTIELLERVAPTGAVSTAVEHATSAGVLEVAGDRLQFVHPLFASTLYHAISPTRRRTLHRTLATVVSSPDERARHLALAAHGPDRTAAAAVEAAARRAATRGAPDAGAELAERADELTPPGDVRAKGRRRIAAGEYHFLAGNLERARQIFEDMATALDPGPVRAAVLRRLAKVRYRNDSCSVASQLLTRALGEAGGDRTLRAGIERDLAWAVMLCGDMDAAAAHAQSALRHIGDGSDDAMRAEVLAATAMAEFLQGGGIQDGAMREAIELAATTSDTPIEWRPNMMLGMMLNWSGATAEARRRFDDLHRVVREAGDDTSLPFLLAQMSESATWDGDWAAAVRHAGEAVALSLQTGQEPMRAAALYAKALAEAHRGNLDEARTDAHAGLELAEAVGSVVMMIWNQAVLGFVELSVDDPAAAHQHLAPLIAWRDVVGIREPGMLRFMPDEIEALVALGQLERADALLVGYEADSGRLQRPWAQLAAARCRALLTAAAGDVAAAVVALGGAIEELGDAVQRFERARALFVLGSVQRRTRRRADARASLQAAHEMFEELGAATWVERTARLLGPARSGPGPDGALDDLTPAERRVADAVAGGATNREAAALLFVSVRTVELHLTSVYRKLGIRSRTELAARMAARAETPDASAQPSSG